MFKSFVYGAGPVVRDTWQRANGVGPARPEARFSVRTRAIMCVFIRWAMFCSLPLLLSVYVPPTLVPLSPIISPAIKVIVPSAPVAF